MCQTVFIHRYGVESLANFVYMSVCGLVEDIKLNSTVFHWPDSLKITSMLVSMSVCVCVCVCDNVRAFVCVWSS